MIAANFRKRKLFIIIVLILLSALAAHALRAVPRGPLECVYCQLGTPTADRTTHDFMRRSVAPVDKFWPIPYITGTSYKVCNRTHCVDYKMNLDGNYIAIGLKVARDPPDIPRFPVILIEPPPRQPPPRQSVIPRPPMPGKPGRAGCLTVGKKSNPCPTVPL